MFNNVVMDDYFRIFTTKDGADILPYAYLNAGDSYEKLVRYCSDYYLFNDEVELIKKNQEKIQYYLREVTDLIEVGPGSEHTNMHKTLPILLCIANLEKYYPVDLSNNYLIDVCKVIKRYIPHIGIYPIEYDIVKNFSFKFVNTKCHKKALILLGGTLGNFSSLIQDHILTQIYYSLGDEDLFMITFDTNLNKESLIAAYHNVYAHNLLKEGLAYFTKINPEFSKYLDFFQARSVWNSSLSEVELFFEVKKDLKFLLPNYGQISLSEGQELRGIKSKKYHKEDIINLLARNNISVIDILDNSQKMQLMICRRRK